MEQGLSGKCPEIRGPVDLAVTAGSVPVWLQGTLFRNGPGQFDVDLPDGRTFTVPHWFDGLTQLHAFDFARGRVSYRSRHLYPALEAHIAAHRSYGTFAGLDAAWGALGVLATRLLQALRLAPPANPKDPATGGAVANVGVTIGHVAGRLVSKTDANALVDIDPATLAPGPLLSYTDINPEFRGHTAAAHGQRDEAAKTFYNFTLELGLGSRYRLFAIPDADPGGHLLATIQADPAYVHSFAMTERFLVLMVMPLVYSPLKMALYQAPGQGMSWQPQKGTLFYVVDKRQGGPGHVATYKSRPFYCFHTINAWEEGGALHIDLCGYDDAAWFEAFRLPHMRSADGALPQGDIRRYTLPDIEAAITAGPAEVRAARGEALAGGATPSGGAFTYELPRINKAKGMRPYQYVYAAAATTKDSKFFDAIAKVDVRAGTTELWHVPGHFPGEPIFVARPGATREDDGVLLVVVLAGPDQHSYLLVLGAGSMREVARARVPHVIRFGFHGNLVAPDGSSTDLA